MKRVTRLVAWMLIAFLIAGNLQAPVFAAAADEGVPEQDVIEAEVLEEPSEGAAGPEELLPEAETAFSEAEDPASDDEAIDAGPDESVQETEASDTEDEEAGPEGRIFDAEEDKAAEENAAAEEDALPEQEAGTSEPADPVPADSEEIDADLPEETDADVPEGTETVEEDTSETGGFDNAGEAEDAFQDVLTDPQDAAEQETPEEASSALEEETAGEPLKEEVSEERLQSGADPEEENSEQEYGELYVWSEGNPYESWQEVDILGCESVTLSVYAENSLGHEVRYQWFKKSRQDQNSYFEDEWTEIAGATEKDYVVEAPTCLDRFRCVVTDTDQNEGCVDFELRAENGFYITRDFNKDGYIIDNIQDVRGLDSITIHLETYAEDLDGITYQWYRQDGEDAVELEGETGDSLTVQDPQNGTAYFCNARDKYGYSSTLWCYFRQNNNLEVYAGYENDNWVYDLTIDPRNEETYTLTPHVEADDMEGLRYSWSMWDGNDTYDGIGEEESLYIDHQPQGNTTYYCEVTDRFGNSGTARYYFLEDIGLEVYPEGASADHPSASYLVAGMDKITLTAVVHVEEGKSVSYYWRADSSKERILDEEQGTIRGSGELTLKLSLPEGGETFYCEVSDGHGNSKTAEFHFEEIAPLMAARPDGAEEGEDTAIVEFDPDEPTWFSMRAIYEGEEDENNILYTWKDGNGEEMRSGYGYNYYGEGKDDYEDGERISCTLTDSFGQTATVYFVISVKTKIAAAPEQTFFRNWGAYGGDCESGDARISYTPGQEITLKTVAETRPAGEITYAWYASEEEDPEDWGEPIAGETNRILKVQDPHKNYRCVATAVGKDVSAHATFYLEAENHLFVYPEGNRRKDDTAEIYAEAGKPVTLKAIVEADDSTGLTYKWFRETVTEEGVSDYDVQVDGASDSLVTGPVTEQTGYCCRVEDQYGNSGSAYFKINLNKLDVYPVGRTTSSRFREIEAALGGTVTLKAKVVTSDPGTVVTWKYRDLESESGIPVTGTFDSASSTAELVLDQISKTGTYECQVKDSYGNEESAYFGVLVNHFRAWPANDPDSSAVDVRAVAGSDVTLRIGTEGDDLSKVTYTWEKVEEIWDSDTWEYRENVQTVGSDRDLILQGVTDTATYRCRVSDGYGNNKEISFYLNVNAIVVEKEGPSSFSIRPGESVTMKVKAEGGPDAGDLTYRWETDGNTLYGKTSDTLTITPEKSGFYCCYVRDGSGNEASADFNVEVNHLRAWPKEQEEGLYYDFRPVEEGSIVRLETAWDADDKDVSFRWEDDDGEIEGAVSDSLTTEPVTEDHYYTCTVSDKYGNKEEVRFSVYITGKDFAVRPEGCEEGENETIVDADDGRPVSLKVVLENAEEGETYTYRWIDATDGRRKIINGAASDTLVISKARANERYICQATNKEGYSENTPEAVFNIRTNHFRATSAVGQKDGSWDDAWKVLAYPGEMATLKVDVTADDTSALTYKWLDDGDVQEKIFSDTPGSCRVRAPKEEEYWGEPFFYTYFCYISDQYGNEEKITFHVYADKNAPVLKEIKEGDVVLSPASGTGLVYDGKAKEPEVTVTVDEKVLEAGTDYEVSYSGNVNAGENTAKVTVTGKGDYEGVVEKTFSIAKAGQNLKADDLAVNVFSSGRIGLTGAEGSVSYTSSTPAIASVDADGTVTGKKAGTAKITVQAKETENYLPAETELTVTVNRIRLAAGDVTVDPAPLTYNGKKQTPAVTVKKGSRKLAADKDYTIVYADNLNAGTAKVTVTGKGNYRGAVEKTFSIAKADQKLTVKAAKALISVGQTTTVSVSGAKGTKTFKSNSSAATVNSKGEVTANKVATVKITVSAAAKPNFNPASASVTIKIAPGATKKLTAANQAKGIKITWQKVAGANSYIIYRNNNKVKTISGGTTVSWADTKADTDGVKYTYKVVANASTGTSSLSRSVTIFRVSAPAIKSLKNTASKKATVTWGKKPKATGYEIQYSLKKNFSGAKTAKITSMTTVSKVIGNLAKGKIWYFRIRAVKKVDSTTYRSVWSSVKSIKITK